MSEEKNKEKNEEKKLPVCQKCRHYKVTWDKKQPHGCLFFSFKSFHLPAVEVQQSTGLACPQFRLSPKHYAASFAEQLQDAGEAADISAEAESSTAPESNLETTLGKALGRILGEKGILH